MSKVTILQQQRTRRLLSPVANSIGSPWAWWSPQTLATVTNCPMQAIIEDWPSIYTALEAHGIGDYDVCRAVLATIAVETAHTFAPVTEAYWLDDAWRYANLRYAPYWGRGYVQLTWGDNYRYYGWRVGHPELVDFPDKALQPDIAAQLLAAYFVDKGVHLAAQRQDWYECRRLVQGAYAGIDEFLRVVGGLATTHIEQPLSLSTVLERARSRTGDPYVWDGETPGGFDCSGLIAWAYDWMVSSYTDNIWGETVDNQHPAPGDIVLYEYYDPSQPNTRFPHVGLWLSDSEVLDARYGYGVGVHPHVRGATLYPRRVAGVRVDTT